MPVASSRKRASSSQAPPPPPASVLYLIYSHRRESYSYSFYALNIATAENDGHNKTLPKPFFRFDSKNFPVSLGFAALDSKIYIIGGMKGFIEGVMGSRPDKYLLDTYVFDTTKPLPLPPAVDDPKTFLIKGPQLNAPKVDPIVVTFDGRIYAFSRSFSHHSPPSPKCEVLDLAVGSWVPLPDPPLLDQDEIYPPRAKFEANYRVGAYIVHSGTFVASTPKGVYCLDLTNPIEWRHVQLLGSVSQLPFHVEAICMDEKCFAFSSTKRALCEYVFALERGLVEEKKNLVNLPMGHKHLKCFVDYKAVHLGENRLCVISCGLDRPLNPNADYGGLYECRNFICYDIFKVRKHRKKKNNQPELLVHLASSTFTMDPGTFGHVKACFPM